jgi:hypothetical protein
MKRLLSISLVATLMLSMAACGSVAESDTMTREEMLTIAEELIISDMRDEIGTNKAKASLYTGNIYIITAYVAAIEYDYALLDHNGSHVINIRAYLPSDDLVNLTEGNRITIVGEMGEYDVEERQTAQYTLSYPYFEMRNVYLVE